MAGADYEGSDGTNIGLAYSTRFLNTVSQADTIKHKNAKKYLFLACRKTIKNWVSCLG
jgi:hypothetical protein